MILTLGILAGAFILWYGVLFAESLIHRDYGWCGVCQGWYPQSHTCHPYDDSINCPQ